MIYQSPIYLIAALNDINRRNCQNNLPRAELFNPRWPGIRRIVAMNADSWTLRAHVNCFRNRCAVFGEC